MKIYLYLKTHLDTGLKYLGKTIQDPYVYKGSGTRWLRHIKKHGSNIKTEILLETENPSDIKVWGEYYSTLWDVANNIHFANIRPESGDGGDTSKCSNYINSLQKRDTSGSKNPMYGRSAVVERNLRWYNNGVENCYVTAGTEPAGFVPGRIISYKTPHSQTTKLKLSQYGKKPCVSPKGEIFESRKAAGKAYGISSEAIGGLIKRGVSGWKWLDSE